MTNTITTKEITKAEARAMVEWFWKAEDALAGMPLKSLLGVGSKYYYYYAEDTQRDRQYLKEMFDLTYPLVNLYIELDFDGIADIIRGYEFKTIEFYSELKSKFERYDEIVRLMRLNIEEIEEAEMLLKKEQEELDGRSFSKVYNLISILKSRTNMIADMLVEDACTALLGE